MARGPGLLAVTAAAIGPMLAFVMPLHNPMLAVTVMPYKGPMLAFVMPLHNPMLAVTLMPYGGPMRPVSLASNGHWGQSYLVADAQNHRPEAYATAADWRYHFCRAAVHFLAINSNKFQFVPINSYIFHLILPDFQSLKTKELARGDPRNRETAPTLARAGWIRLVPPCRAPSGGR